MAQAMIKGETGLKAGESTPCPFTTWNVALLFLILTAGKFSVYSEVAIKDDNIDGYVKPMFANVEVYDYQKDKSKPVLHQAKELVIGGAARLFKNSSTQQVASDIDLAGRLPSPQTSTWQAIGQVLRNAFIEAIVPGFDRAVALETGTDSVRDRHISH